MLTASKRLRYGQITMKKAPKKPSVRVDLPEEIEDKLDTLQTQLQYLLKLSFVSKASTIRFLIRNGSIPSDITLTK